ncbi:sensor histidine kinase [Paraburkholderia youngii]|uniref:sensor histidine kinase n=1 Tax=Paraburkholderia youngii TaxID=2782701 RepID=UPI003D241BA8
MRRSETWDASSCASSRRPASTNACLTFAFFGCLRAAQTAASRGTFAQATASAQNIIGLGQRASEIVRSICSLATPSALQATRLELNDLVHDGHDVSNHRVPLRLRLARGLPPLLGDRVQLQQVFINLVLNGIQAMADIDDRPRELLIESCMETGGFLIVSVRDTGIGIAPEHAYRLFDAFFTTKRGGKGIGLAMCRSIIDAHGGIMLAFNNAGHGATFQCRSPVIEASANAE